MDFLKDVPLKVKLVGGGLIFLLLVAFTSATVAWYKEKNKPPVSKVEYIEVEKVKEIAKIKYIKVAGPKEIVTVEKQVLVEKFKLPDWFSKDTNEQAIASGVIPSYEGDTNVISTLNTETGVGRIISKQEPLSFLGFINKKELYGKLGWSTNSDVQITGGADWKFARIGGVNLGVYGEGKGYFNSGTNTNVRQNNAEIVAGIIITY